jgi:hypothetical protein
MNGFFILCDIGITQSPPCRRKDRNGIWINLDQLSRQAKQAFNAFAFFALRCALCVIKKVYS